MRKEFPDMIRPECRSSRQRETLTQMDHAVESVTVLIPTAAHRDGYCMQQASRLCIAGYGQAQIRFVNHDRPVLSGFRGSAL